MTEQERTPESPSLEDLALAQGVKPVADVTTLAGTWPGEMDDGFEDEVDKLRHGERDEMKIRWWLNINAGNYGMIPVSQTALDAIAEAIRDGKQYGVVEDDLGSEPKGE
ncbi:MAG: hypothetical protein PHG61_07235 [Candidatus Marinimicrobia bacterium]|nr:hypothetical protein [Candidatus Neomarinimicrobiota bacterium]